MASTGLMAGSRGITASSLRRCITWFALAMFRSGKIYQPESTDRLSGKTPPPMDGSGLGWVAGDSPDVSLGPTAAQQSKHSETAEQDGGRFGDAGLHGESGVPAVAKWSGSA